MIAGRANWGIISEPAAHFEAISGRSLGNTPKRFGQLVYAYRQFLARQSDKPKAMVINAWNEWTEGSVLLPTKHEGYRSLRHGLGIGGRRIITAILTARPGTISCLAL